MNSFKVKFDFIGVQRRFFIVFCLFFTQLVFAVNLDAKLTHGITGEAYKRNVTFKQKQHYTNINGQLKTRWIVITRKYSDTLGNVQFKYPDNIGTKSGDNATYLNEFQLITKL